MAILPGLIRMVLPYTSNLPGDVVVNDLAVQLDDTSEPAFDILERFWNAVPVGANLDLASMISPLVSRVGNACRFEVYAIDLNTGKIGSPLVVQPWTLDPNSGTSEAPPEVALCTSYASQVPAGVNAQRRKGRIYVGPFTATQSGRVPGAPLIDTLSKATKDLVTDLADNGTPLCVWSRADKALYPVVRGWVDNAWDTQRRRGIQPSSRATWNLAP